jgi:uncharacterized protein (DUF885 family)
MLDRRSLLLTGAAALAGCASERAGAFIPSDADEAADGELRTLVDRLAERTRASRAFLLRRFDARRLSREGRVLYEAILPGAEADAALTRLPWGQTGLPYPVTHRNGAYRSVGEARDEATTRNAVREVNRDTNRLEGHAARGVIAPDFVLDATIPAVEAAARRAADAGAEKEQLAEALTRQVERLRALRARASSEAGVWRLPGGEDFYALALASQLGAHIDPREAHSRAIERCRALQTEADALLRAQELTRGDVGERLRALARDERHLYADSDAGKAEAVADMNAALQRIRALLPQAIAPTWPAPTSAEVRRLPAAQEAGGAQGRRQGAIYYVDLGAIRMRPRWTLASVVHHELIPGHILQAPYESFAEPPALQLRYAGGYSEGWAIYAEQLADELGAFAEHPVSRIGYLQWMLFRMARVVADTGIHVMRWSRQRAVDEMRALQGDSIAFVSIEDDVLRFCAQPGAFAAQGLAALDIAELRQETQRWARGAFSLAAFHNAMLRYGPLSPPGLAQAARGAFPA